MSKTHPAGTGVPPYRCGPRWVRSLRALATLSLLLTVATTSHAQSFSVVGGTPFEGVLYSSIEFADVDKDSDLDVLITGLNANNRIARLYTNVTVSPCALTVSIAPASSTICAGASLTLTASGAISYTWSNAQSTTAITASPTSTTAYSVTGTTGACSATVTVNPPTVITVQPAASSVVCAGTTVMAGVSVSGTGPFTYQWYKGGVALTNPASATTATLTLTNVTTASAGSYSVVVTGACNSITSTAFSLTVSALPAVSITANPSLTINAGQSTTLTASGATAYNWSTTESIASISVSPTTTTTYSVTGTNTGCSAIATATATVTVNQAPVATANANQTATVAVAFSYTVNAFTDAETPNSLTYTASLSPANGLSFDPVTRVISGTPVSAFVSSVTIMATDAGGLSTSTSFSITTSCPALTASISGALTVCAGQSTVLTAPSGDTYVWSTGEVTASISATAGTYSVTASATVTANPAVVATLIPLGGTLTCSNTSVTLTASGGVTYQFGGATMPTPTIDPSMATVSSPDEYSVTVIGTNGCSSVATTTYSRM